jgi:hypothetical protein
VPVPPAVRRLQRLWLVFLLIAVAILAALPFFDAEPSDIPVALTATLAAAGGIGAFIAVVAIELTFAGSPPANDRRALQEYEARVTLGFVLGQAPAVLGFALAFVFGQLLPAVIGGGLAVACLIRARPSVTRVERLEAQWAVAGSDVSVLRAATASSATSDRTDGPGDTEPSPDRPEGARSADAEPIAQPEPTDRDRVGDADRRDTDRR